MGIHSKLFTFLFWQRWLFISSLIFASAGIYFAFNGNNYLLLPYDKMLSGIFWNSSEFPLQAQTFRSFIYGPLGGTIACTYILLAYIVYYPFKQKQVWARNAIIVAFSFWCVIDSAVCIRFKVYPQIYIINLFSIIVKALPIFFTWNHFSKKEIQSSDY